MVAHRRWLGVMALVAAWGMGAGAGASWGQATLPAPAGDSAEALLGKINGLTPPAVDRSKLNDEKYVAAYIEQRNAYQSKMDTLIEQFYKAYPEHPEALGLMLERWMHLAQTGAAKRVLQETQGVLAGLKDPKKRAEVLFARAASGIMGGDAAAGKAATEAFIKEAPKDPRGAELLLHQAGLLPEKERLAMYRQIAEQYPDTDEAKSALGKVKQVEEIGKPFELEFTDAISGKTISVQKDLKGKVVVVDFWATWCGPCVAEMPHNKEIYAKYKDKGVEFVGVSLDQPAPEGLKALKEFVADNEIGWPQYYQGNFWQSEFSRSWGIDSIPAVFVVDKQGKLASVDARGKLETLIPELLKK